MTGFSEDRERKKRDERERERKGNRKLTNVASFGHLKIKEKKEEFRFENVWIRNEPIRKAKVW